MRRDNFTFVNVDEDRDNINDINLSEAVVYIFKRDERIDFRCPCGCDEIIILNTIEGTKPCWKIEGNSIRPSIDRLVGCRSHFTITNGVVKWH